MKKVFTLVLIATVCTIAKAQNITWVGGTSGAYFTASNWSPPNNMNSFTGSEVLLIGNGTPYTCTHASGSSANAYRPGKLNVRSGASFNVSGTLYAWGTDSINGNIVINSPGELSIRNIAYIGRNANATITINSGGKLSNNNTAFNLATGGAGSSATINVLGGSFNPGGALNIANGAGLTAFLNINGGSVSVPGNMTIGTGGSIYIGGVGLLKMTGNKQAQLNSLITSGQLTCTPGQTLSITYDSTYTYAQIGQGSGMITEYADSVVLKTGDLVCRLDKNSGNVLSYRFKGVETIANKYTDTKKYAYHDFTTSNGFETMFGCTYQVIQDSDDFAHIVFKRPYTPSIGHVTPCDAEIHYALKKNDKGVYVYSKLEHRPNYRTFDIGSWRQVWWMATTNNGQYLCERIYTDSLRSWQMQARNDSFVTTGITEIIKLTSGVRNGKYDGKYEYSMKFWENPVWGFASNINNIGIWMVNASCEYYNEGPTYHELNAAASILHQCMNGVHYGAGGITSDTLTSWTKVFGPYLMLITDKNTADSNWIIAKQRQEQEKALWPYTWVKDSVAYPTGTQRGNISGRLMINDPFKPAISGANAWIGVTSLTDGANGFQMEGKDYQYWVKTDAQGYFTISNVRPGLYSLFSFKDSVVGEFRRDSVVVSAGTTNNLGILTRNISRGAGNLVWEIGIPDRTSGEFKLGRFDYCEGFVQNKFRDSFPNPIEYNVANNDWADKLCYAHTKYPDTGNNAAYLWKWRINFILPSGLPATGNARLTIAYAGSDYAQQWIYVNNENSLFTSYYPESAGGNAFLRQSNYAKYSVKQISIPMNRFVSGSNTITLAMPSNSGWTSHLMYDYLSLEVPGGIMLPLSLLSFQANPLPGKKGQLVWNTIVGKKLNRFEVERSHDGKYFLPIGYVIASELSNYQFTDMNPQDGFNYYRLKLVDNDNQFSYSAVRQIAFAASETITLYPNPASQHVTVSLTAGKLIKTFSVTNADGKLITRVSDIDASTYQLNISSWTKGIYFIQINSGTDIVINKLIKN